MDTQTLLGSVAIGPDKSGSFKLSPYGIAVKNPSGRFLARHEGQLVDVTELAIDTSEGSTYRLPVSRVRADDLLIRSDNPLSALFVEQNDDTGLIMGTDAATGERVTYRAPMNLLRTRLYVKVVNLYEGALGGDGDERELLPLLLLAQSSSGATGMDSLLAVLALKSGDSNDDSNEMLTRALLLSGAISGTGAGAGSNNLGLLLALQGSDLFGAEGGRRGRQRRQRAHSPDLADEKS